MKTLLIIDAGLGQARAYMAKTLLGTAAHKAHLELIDNPNDAELAIVLGTALPADSALNGKQVFLGDINRAVAHPELFLSEAKAMRRRTLLRPLRHCRLRPVVKTHRGGHRLPDRRCAYLYGGKPLKPKPKTRLVGESGNSRLGRRR
jgi:fructose-specific component phosphotransferase system IIB-like protein